MLFLERRQCSHLPPHSAARDFSARRRRRSPAMLIELDQSTIASMTAALEHVCRRVPAEKDNHETRKLIANAMIVSARAGRRSLIDFQEAGLEALTEIAQPEKFRWLRGEGSWIRRLCSVRYAGSSERQTERQATVSDRRPGLPALHRGTAQLRTSCHATFARTWVSPSSWLCAMRSRSSVWRLDADEVRVLQKAIETGDTQDSDLDVKRTA